MLRYRAADLEVETKPDLTPVSESDKGVEIALRQRLGALGRTTDDRRGVRRRAGLRPAAPTRPRLGHRSDRRHQELRARDGDVDDADRAAQDGEVELGVVSMPALTKRWWAVRGQGAFADGRRIHVSNDRRAEQRPVRLGRDRGVGRRSAASTGRRARPPLLAHARRRRRLAIHAGGRGCRRDRHRSRGNVWDLAAVSIVVEEAGGRFTEPRRAPRDRVPASGLATNGSLHAEALAALGTGIAAESDFQSQIGSGTGYPGSA